MIRQVKHLTLYVTQCHKVIALTRSIYMPKYDIRRDFTRGGGSWHDIQKKQYYVYRTHLACNYTR